MENKPEEDSLESSLETPETTGGGEQSSQTTDASQSSPAKDPKKKKAKGTSRFSELVSRINIYFLLFILIIILTAMIIFIGTRNNQRELAQPTIPTSELSQEAIDELSGSEATVGDPKQTLNIESNSVFAGKVLIRDSLDVAGTIKVGGSLNLPGITVSGTSNFDQIQANNLSIAGDTSIQGNLTIQQNLTVSGGATFGGPISTPQINAQDFQITGDLTITRHIDAGGGTPGRVNGAALGSGGTSSVSGTDTAGTVSINIGGSPNAGCFVTVNFAQSFSGVPHIVLTPIGPAGASLNYYAERTASSFSVCTTNPAPAGSSFSFDYIAID